MVVDLDDVAAPRLLERYRLECSYADPIELAFDGPQHVVSDAFADSVARLKFDLHEAPCLSAPASQPPFSSGRVGADVLIESDNLLDEARSSATILASGDVRLLGRFAGVPTLAIGGDRGALAVLRAAADAAGTPFVARNLARGLVQTDDEGRPPTFDHAELAIGPLLAYLDPDVGESAGYLFALANSLPTGARVAVPQTARGAALTRNAVASMLFASEARGEALVVLRRLRGATARPILPPTDQAALDETATERIIQALVGTSWNCVDIGASKGDILSLLTRVAVHGQHHAFEPLPYRAEALRRAFPSVTVHEIALSHRRGRSSFVHVEAADAFSGIFRRPGTPEGRVAVIDVETARLDDVLPAGYAPSFVKIDTEGGEGRVISGGLETLARHRPIVLFEHGLPASLTYGTASCDIWDLLSGECALEIFTLDGHGPYSRSEFAGPKLHWNFVALPPGTAAPWAAPAAS
jgi:FkbM family methyltransferase